MHTAETATMIINWLSEDTRRGLQVGHIETRETTVMKNKRRCDLPSHNDNVFNPSNWEEKRRRITPSQASEKKRKRWGEMKAVKLFLLQQLLVRKHRPCWLAGSTYCRSLGNNASEIGGVRLMIQLNVQKLLQLNGHRETMELYVLTPRMSRSGFCVVFYNLMVSVFTHIIFIG